MHRIDQDDYEEQRDQAIADAARRHAKAIDANISEDHKQTLHDIGNALGDRLADNDTMGLLVRTARMCNALLVGQMVCDLIQKCIDDDAELEAEKEVARAEAGREEQRAERRIDQAQFIRSIAPWGAAA